MTEAIGQSKEPVTPYCASDGSTLALEAQVELEQAFEEIQAIREVQGIQVTPPQPAFAVNPIWSQSVPLHADDLADDPALSALLAHSLLEGLHAISHELHGLVKKFSLRLAFLEPFVERFDVILMRLEVRGTLHPLLVEESSAAFERLARDFDRLARGLDEHYDQLLGQKTLVRRAADSVHGAVIFCEVAVIRHTLALGRSEKAWELTEAAIAKRGESSWFGHEVGSALVFELAVSEELQGYRAIDQGDWERAKEAFGHMRDGYIFLKRYPSTSEMDADTLDRQLDRARSLATAAHQEGLATKFLVDEGVPEEANRVSYRVSENIVTAVQYLRWAMSYYESTLENSSRAVWLLHHLALLRTEIALHAAHPGDRALFTLEAARSYTQAGQVAFETGDPTLAEHYFGRAGVLYGQAIQLAELLDDEAQRTRAVRDAQEAMLAQQRLKALPPPLSSLSEPLSPALERYLAARWGEEALKRLKAQDPRGYLTVRGIIAYVVRHDLLPEETHRVLARGMGAATERGGLTPSELARLYVDAVVAKLNHELVDEWFVSRSLDAMRGGRPAEGVRVEGSTDESAREENQKPRGRGKK